MRAGRVTCEISAWEDIIVQVVLSAEMLNM